ncbi:helix-turn-helix domain-containing protein [Alicyclobacillus tolerans]|uniref:helix-turn-helix domain-containing protein n=1 Tax=Alicyclobacillus tolerans TaxID=90970 RepID=UPI001F483583|nr:helix-turn-helix domain-containing protein [Alicyclobacillus tolerans]MCF8567714.1 helix-turn-helix domain-containing protein [Alicyclobacillus tolerans]
MADNTLAAVSEHTALEHILKHHAGADGWITLARWEGGRYKQYHYRLEEIAVVLSEWLGDDVYFSQNTFYRPSRKIEYIRQLRALYVDVDCYLLNFDPEWVIGSMETGLFRDKLPDPNIIIHSGRGIALVWFLEPVPAKALPLWQAVENYLVRQLSSFGGDAKATDAARILRMGGTVNSKSNEPVLVQYRHEYRYQLRDIEREYLPPLSPKKLREQVDAEAKVHHKMYKVYSLHYTRLTDLVKLCELREWNVTGHREVILFLYRYWSCCFLADTEEALQGTLELNEQFTEPLPEREVVRATKSAEKAFYAKSNPEANRIAKEKGYPGAGYNVRNAKLIEWLDISEDEEVHMQTIIGRNEKRRRDRESTMKQRREQGVRPRDEYIAEAEKRRQEAVRLREQGKSYRAIGSELGISHTQVSRLINSSN